MLGFRNPVQEENAVKVRESMDWEENGRIMYVDGRTLVCHEFLPDGRYRTEYFKNSLEELAEFICANDKDKLICNGDDYAIASTMGKSLDLCVPSFRSAFFDILTGYQTKCGLIEEDEY